MTNSPSPTQPAYSGISEAGLRSRIRAVSLVHERVRPHRNIVVSRHALDVLLLTGTGNRQR